MFHTESFTLDTLYLVYFAQLSEVSRGLFGSTRTLEPSSPVRVVVTLAEPDVLPVSTPAR
jgi:hypothetical protein